MRKLLLLALLLPALATAQTTTKPTGANPSQPAAWYVDPVTHRPITFISPYFTPVLTMQDTSALIATKHDIIKNQTSLQSGANFNISGIGKYAGVGVGSGTNYGNLQDQFAYTSIGGSQYWAVMAHAVNTPSRLGIFVNGIPTQSPDVAIGLLKIFGYGFPGDELNSWDLGIYTTSNSIRFNSKANGIATRRPFKWSFQDTQIAMQLDSNKNLTVFGSIINPRFSGNASFGNTLSTFINHRNTNPITGAVASYANRVDGQIQSDVTGSAYYNYALINTQTASFTNTNAVDYYADQDILGAGSSITNVIGFDVSANLLGSTLTAGVRNSMDAGPGKHFLYSVGTAPSYHLGNFGIGIDGATSLLQVTQPITATGTIAVNSGSPTVTGTNTTFLTTFKVGQNIAANTEMHAITAIASNTSMTVSTNWAANFTGNYTSSTRDVLLAKGNGDVNIPNLTASLPVFTDANKNITSTGPGTNLQYIRGDGALATLPTSLPPTGSAGGDLAGTYPNPTVNTINGITKYFYDPTSSIQTQLNARELLSNKATGFSTLNNTLYPSIQATAAYIGQTQVSDYVISINGSIITATPRNGSGLTTYSGTDAYTVIQSAITALTPAGAVTTGGGKITILKGNYSLTDELTVIGWEGTVNPYSQLIIEGEGFATQLTQMTSGKNGLVVKNAANVPLRNFTIIAGPLAKSAILGDDNGSFTNISFFKSSIDNVYAYSSNSFPTVLLKNFALMNVGLLLAENTVGDGLVLQNTDTGILYGNSNFNLLHLASGTTTPSAGLKILSTSSSAVMNLLTFDNVTCTNSYYGIYTDYAASCKFGFVDLENTAVCIGLGQAAGGLNNTSAFTFESGYLLPRTGGTAIATGATTSSNNFTNILIQVPDPTSIPINDLSTFARPNNFDIILTSGTVIGNIVVSNPNTPLRYRTSSTTVTKIPTPTLIGTTTLASLTTNGGLLKTDGAGVVSQTGAGTPTTLLHGGTSPAYSAVNVTTDITGVVPTANLGSGTANSGTILYGDQTYKAAPVAVTGANPTGTIGLTAVNGSASTFLRSDGAPALSQSIIPTWTGVHTFNSSVTAASALAKGQILTGTLTAAANNDFLYGLYIAPTFVPGAFTGVTSAAIGVAGDIIPTVSSTYSLGTTSRQFQNLFVRNQNVAFLKGAGGAGGGGLSITTGSSSDDITWFINSTSTAISTWFHSTGNVLFQNGGTLTDNTTDRVQVSGTIMSGLAGTTAGGYKMSGNTSGTISITPQAAAGTYTLQYPSATPTTGQVMAYGTPMTWVTPALLSANQTWTGTNTFVNTVTANSINYTNGTAATILAANAGLTVGNSVSLPLGTGTLALIGDLNNLKSYTVATLPASPTQGSIAYVTDALTPTFLVAVVGGGSTKAPVFYNGTSWVTF